MNIIENNFILLKKYNYEIDFDLRNIPEIEDLELVFNIINPKKVFVKDPEINLVKTTNNIIKWSLIQGKKNMIRFSFWQWNYFLIGIVLITLIVSTAYLVRFFRYQIGSDLPELPSN